jgi:hypothetical protein
MEAITHLAGELYREQREGASLAEAVLIDVDALTGN